MVEINRRFDFLAPICQTTPSPCAWSPRLFREQVEQFYLKRRQEAETACSQLTGDSVANLFRLFQVYPLPAAQIAPFNIPYDANLTNFRLLQPNLTSYRSMVAAAVAVGEQNYIRSMDTSLQRSALNSGYTTRNEHLRERSAGNAFAGSRVYEDRKSRFDFRRGALTGSDDHCQAAPVILGATTVDATFFGSDPTEVGRENVDIKPQGNPSGQVDIYSSHGVVLFGVEYSNSPTATPVVSVKGPGFSINTDGLIRSVTGITPAITLAPLGIPLSLGGDIVGTVSASTKIDVAFNNGTNPCLPNGLRSAKASASFSVRAEAMVIVAFDAALAKAGVKGQLELVGFSQTSAVALKAEPANYSSAPASMIGAYGCIGSFSNCASDPKKPLNHEIDTSVRTTVSLMGGSIGVYAEAGVGPLNVKAEQKIFEWPGFSWSDDPFQAATESKGIVNKYILCESGKYSELSCP